MLPAKNSYIPSTKVRLLQPHPGPCRGQHCSIQDIRGGPCCATSKGQELWKLCLSAADMGGTSWILAAKMPSKISKSCDHICNLILPVALTTVCRSHEIHWNSLPCCAISYFQGASPASKAVTSRAFSASTATADVLGDVISWGARTVAASAPSCRALSA